MEAFNKEPVAYQIAVTYNCNAACKWCVQHLDVVNWKHIDTDITVDEIRAGAALLKKYGIRIGKFRVTGGEPLTHRNIEEVLIEAEKCFSPRQFWFRIYTNGTKPIPKIKWKGRPNRFRIVPLDNVQKTSNFSPYNVSPADLGIEPKLGFMQPCAQQETCGRWFDCFGFTSCGVAGVLGTMLGDDCYEPLPVMLGRPSVCQHCMFSLSRREKRKITMGVQAGKIPDITKTFKSAIERWKDDPPKPKRFFERLPAEYKSSLLP